MNVSGVSSILLALGHRGLVHSAAVVAKGTEGFSLEDCLITRVDGQGVLLEGYHRNASLKGAPKLLITPIFPDFYRFCPVFPWTSGVFPGFLASRR